MLFLYHHYQEIEKGESSPFTKEELDGYSLLFSQMIAEDFKKGEPEIVFICENCAKEMSFTFLDFASRNREFAKEWAALMNEGSQTDRAHREVSH